MQISYTHIVKEDETEISDVLNDITNSGLPIRDLKIVQSTLEDIFVDLVKEKS
jgi:ABC-2 type transport system ATP-binding protein